MSETLCKAYLWDLHFHKIHVLFPEVRKHYRNAGHASSIHYRHRIFSIEIKFTSRELAQNPSSDELRGTKRKGPVA